MVCCIWLETRKRPEEVVCSRDGGEIGTLNWRRGESGNNHSRLLVSLAIVVF